MNEKTKKILWGLFTVIFIVVFVVWMILNPSPEHIEDTNGRDDYTIEKITEEEIVNLSIGSRGTVATEELTIESGSIKLSNGIRYSSDKFTGAQSLYTTTIFKGSDIIIDLFYFNIYEGNFAFYIVLDDKIVGQVEPNVPGMTTFIMHDIEKTASLSYIIVGESASFEFTISEDF